MKRFIQSLTLVTLMLGMTVPVWGQASTEGREFWVALNMTTGTAGGTHEPFICITTQHPGGSYTISNPADPSFNTITGMIPPTGYVKIIASTNPTAGQIDLNKWYPVGQTAPSMSCQTKNVGLKVTTTVDCSVFAGNMLPQSFDAANILPVTALQTDYITQDYPGYDHGGTSLSDGGFPEITILATENNTQVTVTPSTNVLNSNGTNPISKTLNIGQVLYITGENRASLSGSVVTSNKKIAVFTGVNNTDVPGPKSARDHLYEQNMPTVYWGTHFVVTRSMRKDANRIRVTASNNGTEITVDGTMIATINAGETYEFELCEAAMRTQTPYTAADQEGRGTIFFLDGEAHYLETSCPCAVFSYDVSETYYISSGTSERDPNAHGDPSMVWISPIEQQLRKVTFSVMNTTNTTTHFVNIVTLTSGAASLEVKEVAMNSGKVVYGANLVQPTDVKPVPSNPMYSYARIKLVENSEKVYTITSGIGFIAHVYGSGDKESYAYSCGSAAVEQGVNVDGETFINGYRSDSKFCLDSLISFKAVGGSNDITRVDWNFGDGISESSTAETQHEYTSPGWYDVVADLYGHQACTAGSEQFLGTVQFSFRVVQPVIYFDTVMHQCLTPEEQEADPALCAKLVAEDMNDTIWPGPDSCWADIPIIRYDYGLITVQYDTIKAQDFYYEPYNSITYPINPNNQEDYIVDLELNLTDLLGIKNNTDCDIILRRHIEIVTCLEMYIQNDPASQTACYGETMEIPYKHVKGEIGKASVTINGKTEEISMDYDAATLPVSALKPGRYSATITVEDPICNQVLQFPVDVMVKYPEDIFQYKFNNVLAVYKPGYGGNEEGFIFTAYQWYVNNQPIEGATESIYHVADSTFNKGDIVYVMLTNKEGETIPSCPQTITDVPPFDTNQQAAPAHKLMLNKRILIRKGEMLFDIYGQRVE